MSARTDCPTREDRHTGRFASDAGSWAGFELVNGELKELNVSFLSTFVAGRICTRLDQLCRREQPWGGFRPRGLRSAVFRTMCIEFAVRIRLSSSRSLTAPQARSRKDLCSGRAGFGRGSDFAQ